MNIRFDHYLLLAQTAIEMSRSIYEHTRNFHCLFGDSSGLNNFN